MKTLEKELLGALKRRLEVYLEEVKASPAAIALSYSESCLDLPVVGVLSQDELAEFDTESCNGLDELNPAEWETFDCEELEYETERLTELASGLTEDEVSIDAFAELLQRVAKKLRSALVRAKHADARLVCYPVDLECCRLQEHLEAANPKAAVKTIGLKLGFVAAPKKRSKKHSKKPAPVAKFTPAVRAHFVDNETVLLVGRKALIAYSVKTGEELWKKDEKELKLPYCSGIDIRGSVLALSNTSGLIKTFDYPSLAPLAEAKSTEGSIALSLDGEHLLERERRHLLERKDDVCALNLRASKTLEIVSRKEWPRASALSSARIKGRLVVETFAPPPSDSSPPGEMVAQVFDSFDPLEPKASIPLGGILASKFQLSPSGNYLAYDYLTREPEPRDRKRPLAVIEIATGQRVFDEEVGTCHSLAWTPDESHLLIGRKEGLDLWSLNEKKLVRTLEKETDCYQVAFSPDGRYLTLAFYSKATKLWKTSELLNG